MVLSSVLLAVVVLAGLLALGRSAIDVAMPEIVCSVHVPRAIGYGKMNRMKNHQCDLNCLPARFGLDFATATANAAAHDKTVLSRSVSDAVPIMLATPMHGCDSPPPRAS